MSTTEKSRKNPRWRKKRMRRRRSFIRVFYLNHRVLLFVSAYYWAFRAASKSVKHNLQWELNSAHDNINEEKEKKEEGEGLCDIKTAT
jgi:hypothetical protein